MLIRVIKKNCNNGNGRYLGKKITRKFWPFGNKNKPEKTPEEVQEEMEIEDYSNLGYIIKRIKEENSKKGKKFPLKKIPNKISSQKKIYSEKKIQEPLLPPQDETLKSENKLTICVEMDDIFLHVFYPDEFEGYLNQPLRDHDYYIDFEEYDTFLNVYKRRNTEKFFEFIKNEAEGVIFSTGTKEYVDQVMEFIDPDHEIFKHRIYQEGCNFVEHEDEDLQEFVKDLDWLGRDLKRTVLVDSKPFSFWCNPDNSIPVKPYNGHSLEDNELDILLGILKNLDQSEDVTFDLAQNYGIRDTLREANLL